MDCDTFLHGEIPKTAFGLEIGPSHQPRLPKSAGYRVETLDHASAEDLRLKYASAGVDTSRIEEVDYISDGGALHEVVPRRGEYDFVYSSHVLEHIPDLLGYIKSCMLLLKDDGKIVLTLPDKRYCFDAFQHPSTTGDVLQAHLERRTRHTPGVAFDFGANMAAMNGVQAWSAAQSGTVDFINDLDEARRHYEHTAVATTYRDYHGWRFTPSSFRLILHDLNALEVVSLTELAYEYGEGYDFHVSLGRTSQPPAGTARIELMRAMIKEQVDSSLQLLNTFGENDNCIIELGPQRQDYRSRSPISRVAAWISRRL